MKQQVSRLQPIRAHFKELWVYSPEFEDNIYIPRILQQFYQLTDVLWYKNNQTVYVFEYVQRPRPLICS